MKLKDWVIGGERETKKRFIGERECVFWFNATGFVLWVVTEKVPMVFALEREPTGFV